MVVVRPGNGLAVAGRSPGDSWVEARAWTQDPLEGVAPILTAGRRLKYRWERVACAAGLRPIRFQPGRSPLTCDVPDVYLRRMYLVGRRRCRREVKYEPLPMEPGRQWAGQQRQQTAIMHTTAAGWSRAGLQ